MPGRVAGFGIFSGRNRPLANPNPATEGVVNSPLTTAPMLLSFSPWVPLSVTRAGYATAL
jgi:hypothetical protein